ncbi:MAG: VCBS repeat-containing protein, partial [Pseudomonadota bacterium]
MKARRTQGAGVDPQGSGRVPSCEKGVALFDCNGDGRMDAFLAGGDTPAALWINTSTLGQPRFQSTEIAPMFGVTGAYPLDINSDGHQDLVVLRVGENQLLRGHGDCTFSPANEDWRFETANRWSTAFSATWEPGANWPTLAIGNYVDREDPDGPFEACDDNALYRPKGDGFGHPIPLSPGYCALSVLFSDAYRIGRATLRLSNDRHYYVRGGAEEMWALDPLRPLGAEDGWPRVSLWGMGIASQDISGDGRPDVMLTSMGDQLLQLSEGALAFRNAPFEMGTTAHRPHVGADGRPSTGWHAEFADLDNEGLSDLFIAKGNVDQMPSNALEDPNS